MKTKKYIDIVNLEKFADDGRLTEPSNRKRYEWRKMIDLVEKLGRPLNEREIEEFMVRGNSNVKKSTGN